MKKFVIALMLAVACTASSAVGVYADTLQDVTNGSPIPLTLETVNRSWEYCSVTNSLVYAQASESNAIMSTTVDGPCQISFSAYTQDKSYISIYVDDVLMATHSKAAFTKYTFDLPEGSHTVKWVFTRNTGNRRGMVKAIKAVAYGDCNYDGNIDLTDAITLLNTDYSTAPTYYDANGDDVVSKEDAAYILRKFVGALK